MDRDRLVGESEGPGYPLYMQGGVGRMNRNETHSAKEGGGGGSGVLGRETPREKRESPN